MKVKVRLFAAPREAVGIGEIEQELLVGATVKELIDLLMEKYPVLGSYAGFIRVAVNRVYVGRETELHDGDEVAWLPPVGGG
jgi:MoaD family protein